MQLDIVPRFFLNTPARFADWFDEANDWLGFLPSSGLTVSADEKHVYVEAAVPGIAPEKIEVTFDKGILWIRGQAQEQASDEKRKFYRKASRSYAYRVMIPGSVDEKSEPEVTSKDGMLQVIFDIAAQAEPKKLKIKT